MTGVLSGVAALASVAGSSVAFHAGYGLLGRIVSPDALLERLPR